MHAVKCVCIYFNQIAPKLKCQYADFCGRELGEIHTMANITYLYSDGRTFFSKQETPTHLWQEITLAQNVVSLTI